MFLISNGLLLILHETDFRKKANYIALSLAYMPRHHVYQLFFFPKLEDLRSVDIISIMGSVEATRDSSINSEWHEGTISRSAISALLRSDAFVPLWLHIATYSTPKAMCSLEGLTKPLREALMSQSKSGGSSIQRYWHARCYVLRWCDDHHIPCALAVAPEDDRKRRLLQYPLSKTEVKKCWKKEYKEEYEAFLRRNLRGVGVVNREAVREVPVTLLSAVIAPVVVPLSSPVVDLDDDQFAQMCIDGGLSTDHFTTAHGSNGMVAKTLPTKSAADPDEPTRREYRKDKSLGKRKGKHGRGQVAVWETWVQHDHDEDE
ncbi:Hypothetical protein, putative [Bodo saltans]|uniref:Uncharacterized protein n=1 Tax=Bodo saltans TaxID=75058 RepID=A0A0S4IRA8_BODSA|nr:Hypothetical protein, putative [Bodo saltans]|eukprot:CUF33860.1 Hypothetical protein, putative [Bodo saltans]